MKRWTLVSSATAPVALIGGWTVAAALQPASYDSRRDTISALAGAEASQPWLMTSCLAVVGACHIATAAGLAEASKAGRLVLAAGGAATLLVAALPLPSPGHFPAATASFAALALWPLLTTVPSRRTAVIAGAALAGLLVWLGVELDGDEVGFVERVVAGAQSLWPFTAAVLARLKVHGGA